MIQSRDNIWNEWLNMCALIYGRADIFIQQILSWQNHQKMFFFFFCRTACNYCSGRSGAFLDILPCRLSSAGKKFIFLFFFLLYLFWHCFGFLAPFQTTLTFQNWHGFSKALLLLVIMRGLLFLFIFSSSSFIEPFSDIWWSWFWLHSIYSSKADLALW